MSRRAFAHLARPHSVPAEAPARSTPERPPRESTTAARTATQVTPPVGAGTGSRGALSLVIEGEPIPKQRPRVVTERVAGGKRRTRTFTPERTERAEAAIRAAAQRQGVQPMAGELAIDVTFYRSTAQRCDVDNLVKTLTDALNGIAYADDSQITDVHARKRIDRTHPRTELMITPREGDR